MLKNVSGWDLLKESSQEAETSRFTDLLRDNSAVGLIMDSLKNFTKKHRRTRDITFLTWCIHLPQCNWVTSLEAINHITWQLPATKGWIFLFHICSRTPCTLVAACEQAACDCFLFSTCFSVLFFFVPTIVIWWSVRYVRRQKKKLLCWGYLWPFFVVHLSPSLFIICPPCAFGCWNLHFTTSSCFLSASGFLPVTWPVT